MIPASSSGRKSRSTADFSSDDHAWLNESWFNNACPREAKGTSCHREEEPDRRVIRRQRDDETNKLDNKENSIADLERNKQTVIAFYTRAFNDHQPADAVAKYVGSEYVQHNPDTPNGADAFIQSATAFIASLPKAIWL
jgi:hypothetical protein